MKKHHERYKDKGNPRIRVTADEIDVIQNYRRIKQEADFNNVDVDDIKHLWVKSKESSLFVKNPSFRLKAYNQFKDDIIEELKKHSPAYKKIKRSKQKDGHLLVIDPADVHIGKLSTIYETGNKYDTETAVKRVHEGVQGILDKSNGFNIDKILFVAGNDILHIDTPKRTTTSGTPQDTDGMWYENFLHAKQLYIDVLEHLMGVADITFVFNPSNHDYQSSFFLSDTIKTWFRKCDNIDFDCSISHRKYFNYESNLLGFTHGDKGSKDLPLLMASECSHLWGKCNRRYFYTHHIHSKYSKDYLDVCTVESLRSPSPADSWHHSNGFLNQPAIEGFIHHPVNGQVARLTHYF